MKLPNFMCIGAAKSGTTTLYDILRQHSEIFLPAFKEPHYFDYPFIYKNGIVWYKETYFKHVKSERIIGDFTPSYLYEKQSAKRIFENLGGDIKFIVLLRNPVDRAYSHYLHSKRDQFETLTFKEALCSEEERIKKARYSNDYLAELRFSYIKQGRYFEMLSEYFKYFSKDNFLIINFEEEFINRRKETIDKIFSFLEIDHEAININLKSNVASKMRFLWIRKIMSKINFLRTYIKKLIPSVIIRQIIVNRIHKANIKSFKPVPLSRSTKDAIFNKHFKEDVKKLEEVLDRKMNWN